MLTLHVWAVPFSRVWKGLAVPITIFLNSHVTGIYISTEAGWANYSTWAASGPSTHSNRSTVACWACTANNPWTDLYFMLFTKILHIYNFEILCVNATESIDCIIHNHCRPGLSSQVRYQYYWSRIIGNCGWNSYRFDAWPSKHIQKPCMALFAHPALKG